ncbi:uncharacterized protein PgNI_02367 [Pyricularia grisea]|uniref:Major facilitator superfamily (MFS) profile domain-containing protein n=1 Tax=Pyricularia grisea TaxID=148305 RepID=A0A6P8BF15_PYRGI|nr:uncharacterized protein PgNI_02367 [Pyricularia grisea]TLD15411.1 hypothetical protein PgNI_02367 [Pyricularia grisea]
MTIRNEPLDGLVGAEHPRNWPTRKKWTTIILVSVITFNQAMSSTMFTPGIDKAMEDLQVTNPAMVKLTISIYVIGLAVGPLVMSPLSEHHGRMPVMHATNALFLVASIACAASVNLPMLLVARFVSGAANTSLGGAYVADVMPPALRQRAMNVWTVGPVLAPIVGPIVGGYVSMYTTWRWTFGILSILAAVDIMITVLFLQETYPPRLAQLKARQHQNNTTAAPLQQGPDLKTSMARPFLLLLSSPALVVVSLFLAIAYSYMYIMFTTFADVFAETYAFNPGEVGLSYLGLGIGCLLGQYSLDLFMRRYISDEPRPERNLPVLMAGSVLLALSLFWYGWALERRTHWIVPILGTAVCGFAISLFFLGVQTYIVQVYPLYVASALAASTAVRCIFGLTVPLSTPALYGRLGYGWGNSLLGFLAMAIFPAALWLWRGSKGLCKEELRQ